MRVWRSLLLQTACLGCHFNSHTREGVTVAFTVSSLFFLIFQLTHPWGCDDLINAVETYCKYISTHTPVRVWQSCHTAEIRINRISTHTPVRVWLAVQFATTKHSWFQLTHPWGCDSPILVSFVILQISTHTPVRVWPIRFRFQLLKLYFNSHTREGVTLSNV